MKIRNGFVSNSSSSSFIVYKKDCNELQLSVIDALVLLINYLRYVHDNRNDSAPLIDAEIEALSKTLSPLFNREEFYSYQEGGYLDVWDITEKGGELEFYATMDNLQLDELLKLIGVPIQDYSHD